jgi:hypothetical protein
MKGPYERLKYDLRRLWECPLCKRRERLAATVTYRHCLCQMKQLDGKPIVMKLIADGVQRLVPPVVIQHELPPSSPGIESHAGDSSLATDDPPPALDS